MRSEKASASSLLPNASLIYLPSLPAETADHPKAVPLPIHHQARCRAGKRSQPLQRATWSGSSQRIARQEISRWNLSWMAGILERAEPHVE